MLVSLTNWQNQNNTDEHANNVSPPCQMSLPGLTSDHAECEADNKHTREPPLWRLSVLSHHLQVDIGLLGGGTACAIPDVRSVEEEYVGDCRHEGGKRHAVCERE